MKTFILGLIKDKPLSTTEVIAKASLHYENKEWEILEILDELKEEGKIQ